MVGPLWRREHTVPRCRQPKGCAPKGGAGLCCTAEGEVPLWERTTTGVDICEGTAQASYGCRVQENSHLASVGGASQTGMQTRTARPPPAIQGTGTAREAYSSASTANDDGRNTPRTKRLSALEVPACARMP